MSTPIETNTEQLQEVLQQVYNLPSRSGGSTTPDLVLGINAENTKTGWYQLDESRLSDISIISGSVSAVAEKLKQGITPRILLKALEFYANNEWSIGLAEASQVALRAVETYPSDSYEQVRALFTVMNQPSHYRTPGYQVIVLLDIATGTVEEWNVFTLSYTQK